eukprot:326561-Hanusia_phi.AAC.1
MADVGAILSALTRQMGKALNEAKALEKDADNILPRTHPTVRKADRSLMPNNTEQEQMELNLRKVVGGKWSSSERFKEKEHDFGVGPGHYQPDVSKVVRRTPGTSICPPTRKNLAAHLNEYQKLVEKSEVGPGKYSPHYFATSEWVSTHAPCISRPRSVAAREGSKSIQLDTAECKSECSSTSYSEKSWSDRKSIGCLKWRPDYFPEKSAERTPGPGSYDPVYESVRERVPGCPWQRSSIGSSDKLSLASFSFVNEDAPGPGSYDVKTDIVFRRSSCALFVPRRGRENVTTQSLGDNLILKPSFSLIHPRVRCSVSYREPSVLSQASTERAPSISISSPDSTCVSNLSTKRRSLSFSFSKDLGSRNVTLGYKTVGPSDYSPNYQLLTRRSTSWIIPRASR